MLYWIPRASVIKHHKLGDLEQRNFTLAGPKSRCPQYHTAFDGSRENLCLFQLQVASGWLVAT